MSTQRAWSRSYLQHTRARGADERADRHVDVSRPALVAVEAFLVARLRDQFAERLQVPLVLLPLRGRHPVRACVRAWVCARTRGTPARTRRERVCASGRRCLPRVGRRALERGRSPGTRDRANHLSRRACKTDCDVCDAPLRSLSFSLPRSFVSLVRSLARPSSTLPCLRPLTSVKIRGTSNGRAWILGIVQDAIFVPRTRVLSLDVERSGIRR